MSPKQTAYGQRVKKLYPIGTVYDRLTVTGHQRQLSGVWYVICQCACGNTYTAKHPCHLRTRKVTSCGCRNRELSRIRRLGKPAASRLPLGRAALKLVFRTYALHAHRRGYVFDLTFQQFQTITGKNCYYCGDPPKRRKHVGRYYGACVYNGVDRVKNTLGYTKNNCVPCCVRCNKAKGTDTKQAFIAWMKRASMFISI